MSTAGFAAVAADDLNGGPWVGDGLLRHYNETRALDYYPVCARYVRLVAAKCPTGIVTRCLGDHEALARPPRDLTAPAHWYRFVSLTAGFAKRLGRADCHPMFGSVDEWIIRFARPSH